MKRLLVWPLLLSGIGRLSESGRQKKLTITNNHGSVTTIQRAYNRLVLFFNRLKADAPQLTLAQCWQRILHKTIEEFIVKPEIDMPCELPAPSG